MKFSSRADEELILCKLVDAFAAEMKAKLIRSKKAGKSGWDDPKWTKERIMDAICVHVGKGDPVDIANFCAFLWNRSDEND